nr:MAG TPA: hypothetical protein [Caudoviricetes sp.]
MKSYLRGFDLQVVFVNVRIFIILKGTPFVNGFSSF